MKQSRDRDESESFKLMQQNIFRLIWHKTDLFHQLVFSLFVYPFLFFNFKKTIFSLSLSLSLTHSLILSLPLSLRKWEKCERRVFFVWSSAQHEADGFCLCPILLIQRWILLLWATFFKKKLLSFPDKVEFFSLLPPSWIPTHPWIFKTKLSTVMI